MRYASTIWFLLTAIIATRARAAEAPATQPVPVPSIDITIDTKAAPDMASFAAKASAAGTAYYATLAGLLSSDHFIPPHNALLIFRRDQKPYVAYTIGNRIYCDPDYYAKHANDVGSIIHELAHVVQAYRLRRPPGWITEGIADWVRWFHYEPATQRPHPHGDGAKYDASYRTSAAFLQWACDTYDPNLVMKLNAACRAGHYRPKIWIDLTGKTVEQLGAQWKLAVSQ